MFEVNRAKKTPIVVIRAASGHELSNYEKNKLAAINPNAQENKIETVSINGQQIQIDSNKCINLELGDHALKPYITPADLSPEECFVMECNIDELILK